MVACLKFIIGMKRDVTEWSFFFGKGKLNFKPLRAITSLNRYLEPRMKGVIGLSTHDEEVTRSENMKHALYERITPFPPFNVYDRFSTEAFFLPYFHQ